MSARSRPSRGFAPSLAAALLLVAVLAFSTVHDVRSASAGRVSSERESGRPVGGLTPRTYSIGHASSEPTIGVTRSGEIFTSAIQDATRVHVLRSSKRGRDWEIVSPRFAGTADAHLLSFDPYTYVDPSSSRVFTVDLTIACSLLSYSDDSGESWLTNPLACGRPVNDHQTLFAGPPTSSAPVGYPNVVYYCYNDLANSACSKSLDGGISFLPTGSFPFVAQVDAQTTCADGLHGHGHVTRDGTVLLPRGHCGQPWLAISTDEGATWDRVQIARKGVAHHEAAVASDPDGNLYYVWIARDRLPYLSVSRDDGRRWSQPIRLGPRDLSEANLPTLAVGSKGRVAVGFIGSTTSPFRSQGPAPATCLAATECPEDATVYAKTTWNAYMTVATGAGAGQPQMTTAMLNPADDPVKRGTCGPGRCGGIMDFIDVVIDSGGKPWMAFVDVCTSSCVHNLYDAGNEGLVGTVDGIDLRVNHPTRRRS